MVLAALALVPAPLLPPEALVTRLQSLLGSERAPAYLVAATLLQAVFYGSLGVIAAFAFGRGSTRRARGLRLLLLPLLVVAVALLVRSLELGHVPMLANAVVPMAACAAGTALGLGVRHHGWRATAVAAAVVASLLVVVRWSSLTPGPRYRTAALLQRVVDAGPELPEGDARFGRLLQVVFAVPAEDASQGPVEHNASAVVALGIVMGHERLARFAGLSRDDDLVRAAVAAGGGAKLRGREDWARHFCVSAALAVAQSSFVSDLGGLLKEEVDALAQGTGFSFGDLAADRAGTRFAAAATASPDAARAAQARLHAGFSLSDYFPQVADLAENLTVEQFRRDFDGVGAPRYRAMVAEIESRLDRCPALRAP